MFIKMLSNKTNIFENFVVFNKVDDRFTFPVGILFKVNN